VALYGDPARATADGMIGALRGAITPRTKVVALTRVHSETGAPACSSRAPTSGSAARAGRG
jgi:hypothetical protein